MQGEVQQFSSAPQAVQRKRYREDDKGAGNNGIMHDKRVVRGNTYASLVTPQQDMAETQKQREAQRRRLMRANQTKKRAGTPEPVLGRKHMDIQTDSYLEELTERTVEFEAETQTDFLLDRPPSPLFMPAKIGVDIETQIEEGELFDFDVECEPVLEVLVGKTLEQSMMEVLEEEELESLRRHQEDFEKKRNAELLEVQRMEAAEKRREEEMKRRLQQQSAQREQDLSMMRKVVSRSIASAHLSSLKDRALGQLRDSGVFADSVQLSVNNNFMPSLMSMVNQQMQQASQNRQLLSEVMQSAVAERISKQNAVLEVEKRRLATIDEAERQSRVEIAENREREKQEEIRIQQEKDALLEWEAFVPEKPEPPAAEEFQIVEFKADDKVVVLADERTVPLSPEWGDEQTEQLQAALTPESLEGGKRVMAALVAGDEEGQFVLGEWRVADPAAEPAADEAPAGE